VLGAYAEKCREKAEEMCEIVADIKLIQTATSLETFVAKMACYLRILIVNDFSGIKFSACPDSLEDDPAS